MQVALSLVVVERLLILLNGQRIIIRKLIGLIFKIDMIYTMNGFMKYTSKCSFQWEDNRK